jgi:hypothetical protein
MLTEQQRKDVWEGWLSGEMRACYFADLCGRSARRDRWIMWATFVLSSGAAYALVAGLRDGFVWVAPTLALLTAALTGYSLAAQHRQSASQMSDVASQWSSLSLAWKTLWETQHDPDAPKTLAALLQREESISKVCYPLPVKRRLLAKWQDHVLAQHADLIQQSA